MVIRSKIARHTTLAALTAAALLAPSSASAALSSERSAPATGTASAPATPAAPSPTPDPRVAQPTDFRPEQFTPVTSTSLPLENGQRIVMRVDNAVITWDDLTAQTRLGAHDVYGAYPGEEARIVSAIFTPLKDPLILTGLYRAFATRHRLMPESREIERAKGQALAPINIQMNKGIGLLTPDQLAQLATDRLIRQKVNSFLGDRATSTPPTAAQLQAFIEEYKPTTATATVLRARHIVIRATPDMTEFQKKDARARAEEILARIKGAPADTGTTTTGAASASAPIGAKPLSFRTAARQFSQDRFTAYLGGELGYSRDGTLYPAANAALEKLKPGEISPVIETPVGYHIFQLTERHHDDLRIQYDAHRRGKAITDWQTTARERAKIEVFIQNQ